MSGLDWKVERDPPLIQYILLIEEEKIVIKLTEVLSSALKAT